MKVLRMGAALAGGLLITAFAGASLLPMSLSSAVGAEEAAHVRAASGWSTISAGGLYTCGIRPDHTLWCWGHNGVGQLGLGDTKRRATPSQVGVAPTGSVSPPASTTPAPSRPTTACGAGDRTAAGSSDWVTTGKRKTPTRVGADTDWTSVAAGYTHTCGIRTDHTLWCWGGGSFAGQLGLGDLTDRSSPTQVGTRTDWATVRAGDSHTCATRTDHTLWCWGYNAGGQLGLGDFTEPEQPHPGRQPHRLGGPQCRGWLPHLRHPHRPHPVVLGIQRLGPARARRHHESDDAHAGRHRERLAPPQRRPQADLRNPSGPHPVVLGAQQHWTGRSRRHD